MSQRNNNHRHPRNNCANPNEISEEKLQTAREYLHVEGFPQWTPQQKNMLTPLPIQKRNLRKKNKHLEEENRILNKENMGVENVTQPQELENIKSHYAQLEENKKPKQLEHKYEIMERKMHLKVAELEEKLKDAHLITEIENDYKQYQLNKHMEAKQQPQEKCQEFELKNQRLQNRNAETGENKTSGRLQKKEKTFLALQVQVR